MEIAKSLIETLKKLCLVFNEAQVKFCLIGGLAVGILARPRATEDIDLLVLIDENQTETIAKLIRDNFEVIQDHNLMRFKQTTVWRIVIKDTFTNDNGLVIIDLVLADNEIYRTAVLDVITIQVDKVDIPLVKAENLIIIKRLSNRPRDLLDIQAIEESIDRA
ncbi:MAG: nucleotidyl transferase AbiEii/AbiGii toxin family protein [Pseudomonadota bacterium]